MDWWEWAGLVVVSMAGGIGISWAVSGYYHLRYYVRRRHEPETWKCQPKRFLPPELARHAMKLGTLNLAIGGFLSGTLIYAVTHGFETPVYFQVSDHGWAYTLGSTVFLFVLADFLAYWTHRLLHVKPLFQRIHHWHHRYVATTPFVTTAMHPVEFLMFQGVAFLPLFLFPFHYVSIAAVLIYALVFNTIDHSGVRLESRIPWQGPSTFHDDHHAHFHCNFGQHMALWDRLFGTLRRKDRAYGADAFHTRSPSAGAGGESPYVRY